MSDSILIPTIPSTPDTEWTTLLAAILRHLLTIGSTLGVVHGVYSDSMLYIVAGALVGLGASIWSLYQKVQAKKASNKSAVLSAIKGTPVKLKSSL